MTRKAMVHWRGEGGKFAWSPICGVPVVMVATTSDRDQVTCESCKRALAKEQR